MVVWWIKIDKGGYLQIYRKFSKKAALLKKSRILWDNEERWIKKQIRDILWKKGCMGFVKLRELVRLYRNSRAGIGELSFIFFFPFPVISFPSYFVSVKLRTTRNKRSTINDENFWKFFRILGNFVGFKIFPNIYPK